VAPSPIPRPNGETPKELCLAEIEDLIQAFILAAGRAKKAGFDGVMIHMAHADLLQGFGRSRIPVRRIGDASAPRKLFDAIHEGYQVGIEI
jgi:2,4-dienoyl-CoA reductase-like NADH-dependent reductase (Old Yellow Enzyme family)